MAAKVMLVEDDTNLSEIYRARLEAEGFQIVSANDGEAALALAVKEHPDLIISDVMMPKISGFDMLDILRGTEGIKNTKIIMMTALSQAEDKARADKLGADRYLVKSQVTLEDVVRAVHEVLGDSQAAPQPAAATPSQPASPANPPAPAPSAEPAANSAAPAATNADAAAASDAQSVSAKQSAVLSQIQDFVNEQEASAAPAATNQGRAAAPAPPAAPSPEPITPAAESSSDEPPDTRKKVIQPLNPIKPKPDINKLLAEEERKSSAPGQMINDITPPAQTITPSSNAPATANPSSSNEPDPNQIAL